MCAGHVADDFLPSGRRVVVPLLTPPFDIDQSPSGDAHWVNILDIEENSDRGEVATIFPLGVSNLDAVMDVKRFRRPPMRVTREGIVLICRVSDGHIAFRLPTPFAVVKEWLSARGIEAQLSSSGRIATQIVRRLGGLENSALISNILILKLLDSMAAGLVETPLDERPAHHPKVRGRTATRKDWWAILSRIHEDRDEAERAFEAMTQRGILRLGLKLKCPTCAQMNWYPIGQIADEMQCERCLETFLFPSSSPPEHNWAYRTQGPFSIEGFAHGAYAVVLALRLVAALAPVEGIWVPSLSLRQSDKESEIDFAILGKMPPLAEQAEDIQIFGECKTLDRFAAADFARARHWLREFPSAIYVFATLRNKLDEAERRHIANLARTCRRVRAKRRAKAPILILTELELSSKVGIPSCWSAVGGLHADVASRLREYDLLDLCAATLKLHVGMDDG